MLYLGYPKMVRVDKESAIAKNAFHSLVGNSGLQLVFSGIQSHNAIGLGEW